MYSIIFFVLFLKQYTYNIFMLKDKIRYIMHKKKEHNLYNNGICEKRGHPVIECHVNYYNIN